VSKTGGSRGPPLRSGFMIGVRRWGAAVVAASVLALLSGCTASGGTITLGGASPGDQSKSATPEGSDKKGSDKKSADAPRGSALKALADIEVKGRAPTTGYDRDEFGTAWKDVDHNGCDTRDDILARDLKEIAYRPKTHDCVVVSGVLDDRYTGKTIQFRKASAAEVQIDHVVALENAWVTGAFRWSEAKRTELANDPLNLLAVDGSTNESKGSGDAATWLPPRKSYRCAYVARQVAVKKKYGAWMTKAEHAATERILEGCPDQKLPS
jgi:hypothetical protein